MTTKVLVERSVVSNAAGETNGCSWGPWRPRVVRTSTGDLYFAIARDNPAYETGGTPGPGPQNDPWWQYTHLWALMHFDGAGWSEVPNANAALAICGREPPLLLLGPQDELYVIGWPNKNPNDPKYGGAFPCLWRQSTGFAPEPLPGDWSVVPVGNENWPYTGGSITADGRVVIVQAIAAGTNPQPNVPGAFRYAFATPVAGQAVSWRVLFIPSNLVPYRAEVSFPLQTGAGMDLISGISTLREEQGFPAAPNGAWDYLENAVYWWPLPTLTASAPSPTLIHRELFAGTGATVPQFYPFDAYRDTLGRVHLLVEWDGDDLPDGRHYTTCHVLIDAAGKVHLSQTLLPFARLARMTQDAAGRFFFFALYNGVLYVQAGLDGDTDGTQLGPVLQGGFPTLADGTPDPTYRAEMALLGVYPAGSEGAIYTELSGAPIGQSGTRGLSNIVNILWCRYDFRWFHLRVQLSDGLPVPVPTPDPTLDARVTALEGQLAAVQQEQVDTTAVLAAMRKALGG